MNGLNPTWLFHQSTLFSINCGSHAAIYFFCLFIVLLTVPSLVGTGVAVVIILVVAHVLLCAEVVEVVLDVVVAVQLLVGISAMIAGALLEVVTVVTARVEISVLVRIAVINVTIHVKPMGVEKSVILRVGKTALEHAVPIALQTVVPDALEDVTPIVIVNVAFV